MLLHVLFGHKHFLALVALEGLLLQVGHFNEMFISAQRLRLQLKFSLALNQLASHLFHLGSTFVGHLNCLSVVRIQTLGQSLQVVLSVDQVLNTHLRKSEQLEEVLVSHPFEVIAVQLSIGDVLEQAFELSEVHIVFDLVHVAIQKLAPSNSALPLSKLELGRQRHQV